MHLPDEEFGEDIEFEGDTYHIPSVETSLERFKHSIELLLDGTETLPIDLISVNDPPGKVTSRLKINPDYKSTKRPSPPEFFAARRELFDLAGEWLSSIGAITATPHRSIGVEADDLINQLAIRLPKTLIVTRDKDLLACPTDVLLIGKGDPELNPEKFPVPDEYIHVYRAMVTGDPSDGLCSVKGFGPKAWDKMVEEFGTGVYSELLEVFEEGQISLLGDAVARFKPLGLLMDQESLAYTTYECMKFQPVPAHKVVWNGGMVDHRGTLVTADNYKEVYDALTKDDFKYSTIDYESDVCDESREWCKGNGIKVDVMGSEICGMGLRVKDKNLYFSVDHCDTNNISLDELEAVLRVLHGRRIYAQNSVGFENPVTYNHFGYMLPDVVDTALMASYVDENDLRGLKHLSKRWLGFQQTSYKDTLGERSGMREISGADVLQYGLDDVVVTDMLQNLFEVILQYEGTLEVFHEVEDDAAYFTSLCFVHGVEFDAEVHRELQEANTKNAEECWCRLNKLLLKLGWPGGEYADLKGRSAAVFNKLYLTVHGEDPKVSSVKKASIDFEGDTVVEAFESGTINELYREHWVPRADFNVRSFVQMGRLLYDFLGLPIRLRNKLTEPQKKAGKKAGTPATNEDAIENAIVFDAKGDQKAFLKTLIEYKGYLTKESLFFSKYPGFVHWRTGKLHCSMKQSPTTTRRFSHGAPNLAQLPKKKGKEVRNMLKAPEDWFIFAVDVDSQELELQAEASQDANFLACYSGKVKKDVHALTGFQVAAKKGVIFESFEEFVAGLEGDTKPYRVLGKAVNFATSYLCRAPKLAEMLRVEESEAKAFMEAKAAAFPELGPAIEKYIKECKKRGYSLTFLGARRHLAGHKHFGSKDSYLKQAAERLAWSFKIQSSAAEMLKVAAGRMVAAGLFDDGLCTPVTIIHDEAVLCAHKSVIDEKIQLAHDIVCMDYADMALPVSSTPEFGVNFGSIKEWVAPNK